MTENQSLEFLGLMLLIGILALVLIYFFLRWTFSIDKKLKYMEMQIKLLAKIAEKHGVDKYEIERILK